MPNINKSEFDAQHRHFLSDWGVIEINALVDTKRALAAALIVAFGEHQTARHYLVHDYPNGATGLDLRWTDGDGAMKLPFPLTAEKSIDFVVAWLEANGRWPSQKPDTDGDVERGFRILSGYGDDDHPCSFESAALIVCEWTIYGK